MPKIKSVRAKGTANDINNIELNLVLKKDRHFQKYLASLHSFGILRENL